VVHGEPNDGMGYDFHCCYLSMQNSGWHIPKSYQCGMAEISLFKLSGVKLHMECHRATGGLVKAVKAVWCP
jgi:hypothetical protein